MKALVIIDMVKGFVDKKTKEGKCALHLPNARSIIPAINQEISNLKHDDIIIHVNDSHESDDKEFKMFPKHCIVHSEESEVADGFEYGGRQHIFLPKTRFSAFYNTMLYRILMEFNIKEIIITGVCTDICVMYTVADARMQNYKVIVPKNAVSGLSKEGHKWALSHIENVLGATIEGE